MIGRVIRHVVLFELAPGYDPAELADVQEGLRNLNRPGTVGYTIGNDLGLTEGTWTFGIVADFADLESYRGYGEDPEHDALRARLAAMATRVARVQFETPGR